MKRDFFLDMMDSVDEKYISESDPMKKRSITSLKKVSRKGYLLVAACLGIFIILTVIGGVSFLKKYINNPPLISDDTLNNIGVSYSTDAVLKDELPPVYPEDSVIPEDYNTVYPKRISGDSLEFISGSVAKVGYDYSSAPPWFHFAYSGIVVRAKAVKILDDTYCKLSSGSVRKPINYKVVQFRTLEALNVSNLPQDFLYLMPERQCVDLTKYDSLIISMTTLGYGDYVLKNRDKNTIEAFKLQVFCDLQDQPHLGNMLAFTDGIFDETLWQNDSWIFGYQFAKNCLDEPEKYPELFVSRGCTEESTIEKIKQRNGYKYTKLKELVLKTDEAKEAYDYASPFKNGVFSQSLIAGPNGSILVFSGYINGCYSGEEIWIDITTGEVSYYGHKYTEKEIDNLIDLSDEIQLLSKQYTSEYPSPPHIDEEGKKRLSLSIFGWYAEVDSKIYGILKTVWIYRQEGDYYTQFYDDSYLIYSPDEKEGKLIDRDSLLDLLGDDYRDGGRFDGMVYEGEYNLGVEVPRC